MPAASNDLLEGSFLCDYILPPEEIEAGVKAYRFHISEHNRRIIQVYVSLVADAEPEEGDFEDDEDVNEPRFQA
ncbi:hypothetical protein LX32DRAFT_697713 [Colletotrichum zoysiae]|uniref:Uncharacterized protein n=1 Tax=Colletotrichum zoysiae TaxID=1216348 RepID=A0AAD9H735_9PEZI|nr:hypothetical protein LX32DRAFT_697713 [Colletotrichum zoysiae]